MFQLRGIKFSRAFGASGVYNSGKGWHYHQLYNLLPGFDFSGATLIMKTTTLHPRIGNMPLDDNHQPKELIPRCIYIDFWRGIVVNAVSLSGPGLLQLLKENIWQNLTENFVISIMSVAETAEERVAEIRQIAEILLAEKKKFRAKFAVQLNASCPNTKHNPRALLVEAEPQLAALSILNVPVIIKLAPTTAVSAIKSIAISGGCDAICLSNSFSFDELPPDLKKLFPKGSPLAKYQIGNGALSGKYLLPHTIQQISTARQAGVILPIIACGGIQSAEDVREVKRAGANAFEFGTAAIVRPHRIKAIIDARKIF